MTQAPAPTTIEFRVRLSAATGLFELEVQRDRWSVPIELARIERIVKQELHRRRDLPAGHNPKDLLSNRTLLAEALLNAATVRRIPAKGNRAEAAQLEADDLQAILDAEDGL